MNQEGRQKYMIKLLQNITPSEVVEPETKIKGTTIKKLCEYEAGGYKRVISWLESQQPTIDTEGFKEAPVVEEEDIPTACINEMDIMKAIGDQAHEIMVGRNNKYGDSWSVLTMQSAANLIEMKMHRIANMTNDQLDPKIEDEFIDALNYAKMGLYKYRQINND